MLIISNILYSNRRTVIILDTRSYTLKEAWLLNVFLTLDVFVQYSLLPVGQEPWKKDPALDWSQWVQIGNHSYTLNRRKQYH
jgi:hypothetical protein